MISTQPVGWHHYLSLTAMKVPADVHRNYYVSWEDALWDLLVQYEIPNGATILLPEFFCGDVVKNMMTHGLRCEFYPVDNYFRTTARTFKKYLIKHKPRIVVIFHAVGMTNSLLKHVPLWNSALPKDAILIEDSVHKIVDPQKVSFINDRHFVIDSLRKVTPLPGSNLYSSKPLMVVKKTNLKLTRYRYGVLWWWFLFQTLLQAAAKTPFKSIKKRAHLFAEKSMLKGYELIGDSPMSGKGWKIFDQLALHISIDSIKKVKTKQVFYYLHHLADLKPSQGFIFPISKEDYGELRGFPVGLSHDIAEALLQKLRTAGIMVRFELNDSIWSKSHKVIYLPLGPYLKFEHITQVCTLVKNSV